MARRQKELPGIERQIENPACEEAAAKYCEVRDRRAALSKDETKAQLELEATLRAHNLESYEYIDDNGEVLLAEIVVGKSKVVVRKIGETDGDDGQDAADHTDGLVAQAKKAQKDANVEESDGDVVVPETSAPKSKRKKKGK